MCVWVCVCACLRECMCVLGITKRLPLLHLPPLLHTTTTTNLSSLKAWVINHAQASSCAQCRLNRVHDEQRRVLLCQPSGRVVKITVQHNTRLALSHHLNGGVMVCVLAKDHKS